MHQSNTVRAAANKRHWWKKLHSGCLRNPAAQMYTPPAMHPSDLSEHELYSKQLFCSWFRLWNCPSNKSSRPCIKDSRTCLGHWLVNRFQMIERKWKEIRRVVWYYALPTCTHMPAWRTLKDRGMKLRTIAPLVLYTVQQRCINQCQRWSEASLAADWQVWVILVDIRVRPNFTHFKMYGGNGHCFAMPQIVPSGELPLFDPDADTFQPTSNFNWIHRTSEKN